MKSWGYFIFTAAAVLVFCTRQSSGLELSLCLQGVRGDGCQSIKRPVVNRQNSSGNDNAEAKLLLKNAFMNTNNTVADVEKQILDGLSTASELSNIVPNVAANVFEQACSKVFDAYYGAGSALFMSIGEASKLSNDTARQELGKIINKIELFGLEVIDQMQSLIPVTTQAIIVGGDAGKQSIIFARQVIRAIFGISYNLLEESLEEAIDALSGAQNQPKTMQIGVENQNGGNDSDADAAISKVNKAASDSRKRGANPSKVQEVRNAIVKALAKIGQTAAHVRDYFTFISKLAETDPSSAKIIYLKKSEGVCKSIQEIFNNICLDLGAAALKSDRSTRKQLNSAITLTMLGNIDVTAGNKFAKHLTLFGLLLEDEERNSTFSAAVESGEYGKIAFIQRLVDAAVGVFEAL